MVIAVAGIPALAQAPTTNGGIQRLEDQFVGPNLAYSASESEKGISIPLSQNSYVVAQYTEGHPKISHSWNPPVPRPEIQANIALGQKIAQEKEVNWPCLYQLGMRESGWDHTIYNRGGSGAFGIPQSLPASKLDAYGNRYDPEVQIRWMIDYVNQRYGGACQALQFQINSGWY